MTKEEQFIAALKGNVIKDDNGFHPVVQAVVTKVRASTCNVKLVSNDLELSDVLFSATEDNDKGFVLIPKKDTNALVGLIGSDENSLYLVRVDEVEKVSLKIGTTTLVIDEDGTVYNNGVNGGMVKVQGLTTKLNNLESALNGLVSEFNAHIHDAPQAPSGTIPTAPPKVSSSQSLTQTQVGDLENDKITH